MGKYVWPRYGLREKRSKSLRQEKRWDSGEVDVQGGEINVK